MQIQKMDKQNTVMANTYNVLWNMSKIDMIVAFRLVFCFSGGKNTIYG